MKKIVLITGCSSGIGRLLVQKLSQKSNYLIYASIRSEADISKMKKIWKDNPNIKVVKLDITKGEECHRTVELIKRSEKHLDVLINNAAYTLAGPSLEFEANDYINILNTNAIGPFMLMKEVVPLMKKFGRGKIINITSLNGLVTLPNFGLYSSSKFALEALSRALAVELNGTGISITNVEPGAIKFKEQISTNNLSHTSARDKFPLLRVLLPMVSDEVVVSAIVGVINKQNPPLGIILGRDAKIITFLNRYFPNLWQKMIQEVWKR